MRAAIASLLTIAALASPARDALAMSAPDSTRLPALDAAYRHASPLRLQTDSETLVLGSCRASAEGIRGLVRGGQSNSLEAPRDSARLVRWSDIEGVERGRSQIGLGAGLGAVAGLALGSLSVHDASRGKGLDALAASYAAPEIITISGVLGILLGAAVGAAYHRWEPFSPANTSAPDGTARTRAAARDATSITEPDR